MKRKVAVICGGYSHEKEISMKSVETVMKYIDRALYEPYKIFMEEEWKVECEGSYIAIDKNDFSFLLKGEKIVFDIAFIVIHGTPGEDGKLQGYFDMLGIPYTTPSQNVSALTFNKWACNNILRTQSVRCAKSVLLKNKSIADEDFIVKELGLPCFVKPNDGGSSFGVSKVGKKEELAQAIEKAFDHGTEVVIEEFLKGTEVTNGVYKDGDKTMVLPITEIASENDFFDFEAKYKGKSQEITPARLSDKVTKEVQSITKKVYELLGMKGMVRIDYIIVDDQPYLMEVNTVPGLSEASIIPQQVREIGLDLTSFFTTCLKEAVRD